MMNREDAQEAWEKIVETGLSDYQRLNEDQKVWFTIEPLTTGGIIDHYINNGAAHNSDTIVALEFLGFHNIAELMRKTNSLFLNGHPPVEIDKRNEEWDSWGDKNQALLNEVEEKFWAENEALENALLEHINKTKIGIS